MSAPPGDVRRLGEADDCRCLCGSLLARVVPEGVELRCRRCKRTVVVPLTPGWRGVSASDVERLPARETG